MKKIAMAGFAAAVVGFGAITLAAPGNAVGPGDAATKPSHSTGQIIVKFRENSVAPGLLRQQGLSEGAGIGSTGARLVKVPAVKSLSSSNP
jgi:thermitase